MDKCLFSVSSPGYIVYWVIFDPCNFRPSTLVKSFTPFWIRPDTDVFKERLFETPVKSPSLKFTRWQQGRKLNRGEYFSVNSSFATELASFAFCIILTSSETRHVPLYLSWVSDNTFLGLNWFSPGLKGSMIFFVFF